MLADIEASVELEAVRQHFRFSDFFNAEVLERG